MRRALLLFVSLFLAASAVAQDRIIPYRPGETKSKPEPKLAAPTAQPESEPAPPPGPRIERVSNGVIVVRGSRRKPPAPPEEVAPEAAAAAPGEQAIQPEKRSRQTLVADSNGRQVAARTSETEHTSADGSTRTVMAVNANGREVPSISIREKILSRGKKGEVTERTIQRYDDDGRPSSQEVSRIEKKRLPDGTTETVETQYRPDLNGRLQPAERSVSRTKTAAGVTTTTVTTHKPSINGGFRPFIEEQTVERKIGALSSRIEKTRKEGAGGGRLQLVEREETTKRTSGSVETSETNVYSRSGFSTRLDLTGKRVGRKESRADGSSSETIETYGKETASGATNVNATRMQVQSVLNRETTVAADGSTRERSVVQARDVADSSKMVQQGITERVSKPVAGGESVQTTVYEQGVNGRMRATQVVTEKIEK